MSNLKRIFAYRNDGLGGRLSNIISARYLANLSGSALYVWWPAIESRYYSKSVLHKESYDELFENGEIFKDYCVSLLENDDFLNNRKYYFTGMEKDLRKENLYILMGRNNMDDIFSHESVVWQNPWLFVPNGLNRQDVSHQAHKYWNNINWNKKIVNKITTFNMKMSRGEYLAVHLRRGDIVKRLQYDNLNELRRSLDVIIRRYLPIKTAVDYIIKNNISNVLICSECEYSSRELIDQLNRKNHNLKVISSSEYHFELEETQAAALDLTLMSQARDILAPLDSSFSSCAEVFGLGNRINYKVLAQSNHWGNMRAEFYNYLDSESISNIEERKKIFAAHLDHWKMIFNS